MEAVQKAIADLSAQVTEKFDSMSTDVTAKFTAMTTDVRQLATHVADVQDGIDSVKRSQVELTSTAGPSCNTTNMGGGQGVTAGRGATVLAGARAWGGPAQLAGDQRPALANNGPPLMRRPGDANEVLEEMGERSSTQYAAKLPKHHFPRFAGENPSLWLDLRDTYFTMYETPLHQRVSSAVLYMEGHAALWLQAYKRRTVLGTWEQFCAAVLTEFGEDEYDGQMSKLLQIKQTGSVTEYRKEFETYMYYLISLDPTLNTKFFVSKFVMGLRSDIRAVVRIQAPTSVSRATSLARIQEEELELHQEQHPRNRLRATLVKPPGVPAAPGGGAAVVPAKRTTDDFARERQLRDFRKVNGLCFRCGDKYSRDHQCKQTSQLLTIQLGDFGEILSDDTVHALELLEDPAGTSECCHISVHALAGTESGHYLCLCTMVGNQVCLILVDSGSSHSFVNAEFARRVGCTVKPMSHVAVKVANNQMMYSESAAPGFSWWIQGHTFSHDMRLLELGAYDAILGMDWLELFDPMICHWKHKRIIFNYNRGDITLQGVLPKEQQTIQALELDKLHT
uniref:Uncharacterized protein n=1 Tax=Avena sativa TaxID=4498 RepID=A0ACD6AM41_AVESA